MGWRIRCLRNLLYNVKVCSNVVDTYTHGEREMGGKRKFHITYHARQRFVERFSEESSAFVHLSSKCRGCFTCYDLTYRLKDLTEQHREKWNDMICARLNEADDVRIYLNDTNFMEYMYSKYGYGRYRFLVEGNILFVVTDDNENAVLTCMNVNNPVNGSRVIANFVKRPKFGKKVSK